MTDALRDKQELQDLMFRYVHAVDADSTEEECLSLFTDDAVIIGPLFGTFEGVDGVRQWARRTAGVRQTVAMRHYITNFVIDISGAEGRVQMYTIVVYRAKIFGEVEGRKIYFGDYDCAVRKIDGRWRIQRRDLHYDPN